jgi:hypothetical protein
MQESAKKKLLLPLKIVKLMTMVFLADGCWSKRSYRTNYNALAGARAIVGLHTREVLFLGIKKKNCIICNFSKVNRIEPKDHVCWKHYEGSSTGMEIILEGLKICLEVYGVK